MKYNNKFKSNYLIKLFNIIFFIGFFLILFYYLFYYLNKNVEGLETEINNGNNAFCEINKGFELQKSCNNLTKKNCNKVDCCIWENSSEKCFAGNQNGLLFNTDNDGKTINLDTYFYKNKCYGSKC